MPSVFRGGDISVIHKNLLPRVGEAPVNVTLDVRCGFAGGVHVERT